MDQQPAAHLGFWNECIENTATYEPEILKLIRLHVLSACDTLALLLGDIRK